MSFRTAVGITILLAILAAGCGGSKESVYSARAARDFARADMIRFTDLRPGHHEELLVKKKRVLVVLTESVQGAELVSEAKGPVMGKIELLEGGKVLAKYHYHMGGTIDTDSRGTHVAIRPLPTFHPALFIGCR